MAQSVALCPCGRVWRLQRCLQRDLRSSASARPISPIFSGTFVRWLRRKGQSSTFTAISARAANGESSRFYDHVEDNKRDTFSLEYAGGKETNGAQQSPLHAEERDERKWEFVKLRGKSAESPNVHKVPQSGAGIEHEKKIHSLQPADSLQGRETYAIGTSVLTTEQESEGAQKLHAENVENEEAEGSEAEASLKGGGPGREVERKSGENAVSESAKQSLVEILAGLEQNSTRPRGVPEAVLEGPFIKRVESGQKWEEETPEEKSGHVERSLALSGASSADPQEFVRELSELDGLPKVDLSPQARRKVRTLSSQRVVRTVRFLQGLSASQEKKVRNFVSVLHSQERAVWGGERPVSSKEEEVKAWFRDAELADLLTPLVGRLSTLELNKVLKALGQEGNWKMAVGLLKWMETQPQCQPDEWSYSTVLALLGKKKRSRVAISVFERMEGRGFRPNEYIYSAMISCYASVREYKDAVRTFGKMVAAGIEPNLITWSALIDACAKGGAGLATCLKLFERMEDPCGKDVDEHVYNILADAYAKLGDWKSVQSVIRTMQEKGVQPSVVTLNTLLDGMATGDAPLSAFLGVYRSMLRAGVKADGFSYSILVKGCGLRGDMSALDWVYQEMHSNPDWASSSDLDRVRVYETVLGVYAKQGLVSDALRVFQEIKRQGFEPERVTYNLLITALGQEGQLTEAEKILSVMAKSGCAPNVYSYIALMEAYIKAGELLKVEEVFQRVEEPTVTSFNLLMSSYVQRGRVKEAGSLLTEMRKRGLYPNATSYGILICACASGATSSEGHGFPGSSQVLEFFDDMKVREANGSLFPQARALVIRALVLCGRLEEAIDLLDGAVLSQGGESFDTAALRGSIATACIERGDAQRLARAVEIAVQGGWKLKVEDLAPLLEVLKEKAFDKGVELVLEALGKMGEGSLGKLLVDALVSQRGGGEGTEKSEANSDGHPFLGVQCADTIESEARGPESGKWGEAENGSLGDLGLWIRESPLPSTAELERLFGVSGSRGREEKRPLGESLPAIRRLRKSLVDVQWPQRRRVRSGVVSDSGLLQQKPDSASGGALKYTREVENGKSQAGLSKEEKGNGVVGGKASSAKNEGAGQTESDPSARNLAKTGGASEPSDTVLGRSTVQQSSEDAPLEALLGRLRGELSVEELQGIHASLVSLSARLSRTYGGFNDLN